MLRDTCTIHTQVNATSYGTPLMRPVWWDFDDEQALDAEETTFMFGPDYFVRTTFVHNRAAVASGHSSILCNQFLQSLCLSDPGADCTRARSKRHDA